MKIIKFSTLAILFAALVVLSACKDDSDDEKSAFIGNYTISNAELAEDINLSIVGVGPYSLPAGTDITTQVQNALLSSVECTSAGNAYVELREDLSIYMSCAGDNEFNAGTWKELNDSTLELSMNSTAIPSSPTGFVLTVSNIDETETGMRGKTSVPFPKEMIGAILPPPLTLDPATPAVILVTFFIDFMEQ